MKKLLFLLILIPTFLSLTSPVSAHILASDGSIGAVLHIDPDDDPIANQPSYFFLEIKDKSNKLSAKECNCQVVITENGNIIHQQDLFSNPDQTDLNAQHVFTFPQKDVYQVQVLGKPLTPNAFQEFKLTYNIRVDRIANSPTSNPNGTSTSTFNAWFSHHIPHLIVGGVLVLLIIFGLIRIIRQQPKRTNK